MSIDTGIKGCFLPGQAWKEEPLAALQLIAHLRDIRNGKGENARALDAYVWLARHHPRTLLANLPEMVEVCTHACMCLTHCTRCRPSLALMASLLHFGWHTDLMCYCMLKPSFV